MLTLNEIATQLGAELVGDGSCEISTVADIGKAGTGSIAFVSDSRYEKHLLNTKASAVIVHPSLRDLAEIPRIISDRPRLAYAKVAQMLYPRSMKSTEISSHAVVHKDATITANVGIEACAVVEKGAMIASGVYIGAGSVIGENVSIGSGCMIYPNVTILDNCEVGQDCIVHSGVVIGADGFGFVAQDGVQIKIPQIGRVIVGNDVEIGANTTIDRGAIEDTVICDGVKLDNQIQIAHNVVIGEHTVISAATAIAGTTTIGKRCLIGGCVAIRDHVDITDDVMITGRTLVSKSITVPGSYSSSTPMDDTKSWRKNSARFRSLDNLARRVKQLESEIESLKDSSDPSK